MSFFVNTMVCGFSLYQILAFFLIYSCLGWCLEVIYAAVSTGQLVNRGFLNGPVCPIYGFGMIIVLFTLSPLADNLLLLYIGSTQKTPVFFREHSLVWFDPHKICMVENQTFLKILSKKSTNLVKDMV